MSESFIEHNLISVMLQKDCLFLRAQKRKQDIGTINFIVIIETNDYDTKLLIPILILI